VSWFKLDDATYDHPKIVQVSDGAFRLWVTAGLYCAKHLTDGIISPGTLKVLQAKSRHCDELWSAGLWERIPEGGYRFHDWDHYQPTRLQVIERRRKEAERKAKARAQANHDPQTGRFT
jgi:hypothetical protein